MRMKYLRNIARLFYIFLHAGWSSIAIWNPNSFTQYFVKSIVALASEDESYEEASIQGLFYAFGRLESRNPFILPTIDQSTVEYEQLMQRQIKELASKRGNFLSLYFGFFVWALKQPISPFGSWYSGLDKVFLMASYNFARKFGATCPQAVNWAQKWLPFQPAFCSAPVVRWMRGVGVGQLINISYNSLARFFETHFTRPWEGFGTIITIFVFFLTLPVAFMIILLEKFITLIKPKG